MPPQPGMPGSFQIGGTIAATTANIEAALAAAVREKAVEVLGALAATETADAFFAGSQSNPPQRVAGAPFASATGFVAGTKDDTVIWYNGDDDTSIAARATSPVRADQTQVVAAGGRANEAAIRNVLAQLAVLSAESFTASREDALRYAALNERVFDRLSDKPANPQVSEIASELATAVGTMKTAKERHQSMKALMQDVVGDVEQVNDEETAAAILSLQTRLQASYETTAILSRLTIVNYL
jgi:flagellar hook-associated protein 3 FlgL